MIAAKPTKILAERCKNGIKELKFAQPKENAPTFKYERPTHLRPGHQPTLADPFEQRRIYIDKGVMQDGVFAKKDIKKGELICYLSGTLHNIDKFPIMHHNQTLAERLSSLKYFAKNMNFHKNMSLFYRYAVHRNLISLGFDENGDRLQINLPEGYWNITQFRATLGHKINHDFLKLRAAFDFAMHPRHGWIRSVIAIDDIYKGEEIFIHYHYPIIANSFAPQWYQELYEAQIEPWPKSRKSSVNKECYCDN